MTLGITSHDSHILVGANFSIHLQYILAVVMEMISSNNVIVSQTAIHIAQMIAQSTGYQ